MSPIHDDGLRAMPIPALLSRKLTGFGRLLLWPLRVSEARRELDMLARMSACELKDIGLTPSDVRDATALPADASPTDFLAERIHERRDARPIRH
jgi:uncharacterized protein YjiS (DUF1127 family)